MTGIGPRRRCKRCARRQAEHFDGRCQDGQTFHATPASKTSASNSFTADELAVLRALIKNAATGYDSRVLARQPAYASLARKTLAMMARIDAARAVSQ